MIFSNALDNVRKTLISLQFRFSVGSEIETVCPSQITGIFSSSGKVLTMQTGEVDITAAPGL